VYRFPVCSTSAGSGEIMCEHTRCYGVEYTEERGPGSFSGCCTTPKSYARRPNVGWRARDAASGAACSAVSTLLMRHKVLETERMVLRRMVMSDVDDLMGIFSDPVAMRYYPATKSRTEAEAWVRWTLGSYRDHGFGQWVAVFKDTGEFAGQCGLTVQKVEGEEEVEIGYLFLRRFWGMGLASEAARTVRDHGFALGYRRLVSIIDPQNLASRRVAEKTGLTLEKEVWKWNKKVCIYSIQKGDLGP
jgi:ribosomal-protein-alanine N-acetyltransferase